jgi:UDP-N-acetylmuramate dehydrogenase
VRVDADRLDALVERLGAIAKRNGALAPYSAAGVGGPADVLVVAEERDALLRAVTESWALELPVKVFGGLTNCLVNDAGLSGVIILNHARHVRFIEEDHRVYAESGVLVAPMARAAVRRGWGGLTWAVGLPGTVGGMVVNNAGAFGGETAEVLAAAEIVGRDGVPQTVAPDWFDFKYRCSRLKGAGDDWIVLDATFQLKPRDPAHLQRKAQAYKERRQTHQPRGRTLGSTFKNPAGDYAGRLIEAAGLKGARVGGVVVSTKHANFFVNEGEGTAADYAALIERVQDEVAQRFGVHLEPEIEIIGRSSADT